MGRRTSFGSHLTALKQRYVVRIRASGNKDHRGIDNNGRVIEGERVFSRHLEANNPEHARKRGQRFGKVISVAKLQPEDVGKTLESMHLENIIGVPKPERREKRDVILDNITLDEIVYNKNKNKNKNKNNGRK